MDDEQAGDVFKVGLLEPAAEDTTALLVQPGYGIGGAKVIFPGFAERLDQRRRVDDPVLAASVVFLVLSGHGKGVLLGVRVGSFPLACTWRKEQSPQDREAQVPDRVGVALDLAMLTNDRFQRTKVGAEGVPAAEAAVARPWQERELLCGRE